MNEKKFRISLDVIGSTMPSTLQQLSDIKIMDVLEETFIQVVDVTKCNSGDLKISNVKIKPLSIVSFTHLWHGRQN